MKQGIFVVSHNVLMACRWDQKYSAFDAKTFMCLVVLAQKMHSGNINNSNRFVHVLMGVWCLL